MADHDDEKGGPLAAEQQPWLEEEPDTDEDEGSAINSHGSKAGWMTSAFHNTTAMVGAGVLGLPFAMRALTWSGGIVVLVLATVLSFYTLLQLTWMHEQRLPNGKVKRMNRYKQLTQYIFGQRLGWWLLAPFQIIVSVGYGIAYMVTAGNALTSIWQLCCPKTYSEEWGVWQCNTSFGGSLWILVFAAPSIILSQVPTFTELTAVSLVGAVCSLTYSTIAWVMSVIKGPVENVAYNLAGDSTASIVFGTFSAMSTMVFAYGGHNIALEVQSVLPLPSEKPMLIGVYVAYAVTTYCYFCVAIAGYWGFGSQTEGEILFNFDGPDSVLIIANAAIVVHLMAAFQVYTFIIFDMIEGKLQHKWGYKVEAHVRLVYRTLYVLVIAAVACTLPFFNTIMGLLGAIAVTPTSYAVPSLCWLALKKPSKRSWHWWLSWAVLVFSAIVFVLGTVGAARDLIVQLSTGDYHLLGIGDVTRLVWYNNDQHA